MYPSANAPQAWSASTVPALIQALLSLRPVAARGLFADRLQPAWLPDIIMSGLRTGTATTALRFRRDHDGRWTYEVLDLQGDLQVCRGEIGHSEPAE